MDLLCNAYSNYSDEDDGPKPKPEPEPKPKRLPCSSSSSNSSKRPRLGSQIGHPCSGHPAIHLTQSPMLQGEAPIPGRYISKRERAQFSSLPRVPEQVSVPISPGIFLFLSFYEFSFEKKKCNFILFMVLNLILVHNWLQLDASFDFINGTDYLSVSKFFFSTRLCVYLWLNCLLYFEI